MFRRSTPHYGIAPEPTTPYQRAAQAWDDRIGSARVQARNWRLMAFGSLLLSAGFAAALVWQSAHGTVVPWVVQIDQLGQAQAVAPAVRDFQPSDPQIAWYLALSGILFVTGALGVLVRRSPLIILLSVEIMLNAANLLLIAFARLHGGEDGQIFAISVMAVAASEVVVGLGLIVAMSRKRIELDVDKLSRLRG